MHDKRLRDARNTALQTEICYKSNPEAIWVEKEKRTKYWTSEINGAIREQGHQQR